MKEVLLYLGHLAAYLIATLLLCTIQGSMWPILFASWPPPIFWLYPVIYLLLYHSFPKSIFWIYGLCVVIAAHSSMGLGQLSFCLLIITLIGRYVKKRIFWPGPGYFSLIVAGATFLFPIVQWTVSQIRDVNPIPYPSPWAWISSLLLTPAIAGAFFYFFNFLDHVFHDPNKQERAAESL